MVDEVVLWTIASVFIGFLCFGSSFACFMYKKSQVLVWSLFGVAVVFIALIPVCLAVFVASSP
ncbi:hypothetical protein EML15_03540 [Corynebacterium sp. sy017]|uniref:hypothetical protein n=1 Tax=unclassified Corynebacterium TaxID=2624378 RepID=UPI0011864F6F|nr:MULTISPECIES: hypothetical protein [unclassified Corynebacterium]MBP3088222.1 hypothetical protein [Corynebacterium sp. sy017]QDZ43410.1 hypothetical protein FQV43_09840 [Corynebacterium sp. sy039]TSD91554.1 hypothetical protein ELY17_03540 [Corynebacterium sp. SY003]